MTQEIKSYKRFELALEFLALVNQAEIESQNNKSNQKAKAPSIDEDDDDHEFNEFFNIQDSEFVVNINLPTNMTKFVYLALLKDDLHDLINVLHPNDQSIHAAIDKIEFQ